MGTVPRQTGCYVGLDNKAFYERVATEGETNSKSTVGAALRGRPPAEFTSSDKRLQ